VISLPFAVGIMHILDLKFYLLPLGYFLFFVV
jgi:hypothetical protein